VQHDQHLCTWLHSIPYGPPTFPIDFTGHLCEYELRTTHLRLCILRSPRALGYLGNKNWNGLDAGVPERATKRIHVANVRLSQMLYVRPCIVFFS
jgi:hypothetical protein